MSDLCPECEDSWCGEGYCPQCGSFDECHYRLCAVGENDTIEQRTLSVFAFARDMQGNPRFLAKSSDHVQSVARDGKYGTNSGRLG